MKLLPDLLPQPAFDDRFVRSLPADPETRNFVRHVHAASYSKVKPTPVPAPKMLAWAPEVAGILDLSPELMQSREMADVLGGNALLPGMEPYAARYGGHQFGSWAGQLGDGRAITLGERINSKGERWEMQLKGPGPTPYARMADGRAVLRSSVREFLCSEAMHHLGVPTTRALSLVETGEPVLRDMFYDGNPEFEPGAVVCRVAPSFLRFGSYELPARQGEPELLRRLVDFTIETHFPELGPPGHDTYLAWLSEVGRRTVLLMVEWMRVGFVHGVMNTDNMSILGLTIDYGPYGWIDVYDPDWTPNTTDAHGRRYRFGNQPDVGIWNLLRLAESLVPLGLAVSELEPVVRGTVETFDAAYPAMLRGKLGLVQAQEDDDALFAELDAVLRQVETDMTIFYRGLAEVPSRVEGRFGLAEPTDEALLDPILPALYAPENLKPAERSRLLAFLRRYIARLRAEGRPDAERRAAMNRVNPKYVLRNYLAQQAIDRATGGDPSGIHEILDTMRRPYDEQPGREAFAEKRPDWARHKAGCSMLSCSS